MQAALCTKYGPPEVLQLGEIAKPSPKANELLIKVHATVVTPSDIAFRKGEPFIVKVIYGLNKPRMATQGVEFAGEVAAVGNAVQHFKPGDAVVGMSPDHFGAHAEYLCLAETKPVAIKPALIRDEDAVALCDGALTALIFLRDVAKLQPGQRVLINGASGAAGAAAVQLAKYYGAIVTGVCSGANVALVQSLGADMVIDYTQEDFTQREEPYDVIFDAVGKRSFGECQRALTPNGLYLTTVPTLGMVRDVLWTALGRGKKAKFTTAGLLQNQANLNFIMQLYMDGKLKAVIDRRYPLAQIVEAHRYVETGRKKGTVIITVG